jgi:guanylate kinase
MSNSLVKDLRRCLSGVDETELLECANVLDMLYFYSRNSWNRNAKDGDSPVGEISMHHMSSVLEYSGTREILLESAPTMG